MKTHHVFAIALVLMVAFVGGNWRTASVAAQNHAGWEYQVVRADKIERSATGASEIRELKSLGADGWEAVAMNDSWVLLKRAR